MPKTILIQLPDDVYEKLIAYLESEKKNLNDWLVGVLKENLQKKTSFVSESQFFQTQISFTEEKEKPTSTSEGLVS